MSIAVSSISKVIDARGAAVDLQLLPGSQFSAQVIKLLPDNLVRIAIGNIAIDVQSEVELLPGQLLQLAATRTADGLKLAIVGLQAEAEGAVLAAGVGASGTGKSSAATNSAVTIPAAENAVSKLRLSVPEAAAVAMAAQSAVAKQSGLSQLFANLGAASQMENLPAKLQAAVAQLLQQRPVLKPALSGADLQAAVKGSGVFLEAGLAAAGKLAAGGVRPQVFQGDMKAALIVFRHVVAGFAADGATEDASVTQPYTRAALTEATTPGGNTVRAGAPPTASSDLLKMAMAQTTVSQTSDGGKSPTAAVHPAKAEAQASGKNQVVQLVTLAGDAPDDLLQTLTGLRLPQQPAPGIAPDDFHATTNTPPPPVRGALPTAQPVALASIAFDTDLASTAKHLMLDTDAAIARQTLLQIASLPERLDGVMRHDAISRLNFELPFAMAQGTAVAQFEISRDADGQDQEMAERAWRARFSLDVEPAGPVHVMITLIGTETLVRMWAERPETARQLRAGVAELDQALARADLKARDIVIRNGAPMQPAAALAGHFLDRAL